jgi:hypothetical protein
MIGYLSLFLGFLAISHGQVITEEQATCKLPSNFSNWRDWNGTLPMNMLTQEPVQRYWMEMGFMRIDNLAWVSATTSEAFEDPIVFASLPDIDGDTHEDGYPVTIRVSNTAENDDGTFSFSLKIYLTDDAECSSEWYTPQPVDPPLLISWMVVEKGAYNVSGHYFIADTAFITRENRIVDEGAGSGDVIVVNYPTGCFPHAPTERCAFQDRLDPNEKDIGAITTIQTLTYDRFMHVRANYVARRFIKLFLDPHDSTNDAYYELDQPEEVGYLVFERGIAIQCCENMTFETHNFIGITSTYVSYTYINQYSYAPGIFGMFISYESKTDATGLRVFDRTAYDTRLITQEDQCVEEQTIHLANETASMFVAGQSNITGNTTCFIKFTPPDVTYAPTSAPTSGLICVTVHLFDLFGDGWGENIVLEAVNDGVVSHHNLTCRCDDIEFCFYNTLKLEVITIGEPVRHPWEVLWGLEWEDEFHYGNVGTWMNMTKLPSFDTNGLQEYKPFDDLDHCHTCPKPKPKPSKKGGDDSTGGDETSRGNTTTSGDDDLNDIFDDNIDDHVDDNIDDASGDDGASGDGNNGHGKGKGPGKGKGVKPPPKPVPVPFDIIDEQEDGWYWVNASVNVCPADDDEEEEFTFPVELVYPRYYISNWERTELLRVGTLCKAEKKICQEWLKDGKYVWRVAGVEKVEGSTQWKFCGVEGDLNQELQFTIRKGKCIPGDLIDSSLCTETFNSMITLKGSMVLSNANSAVLTEYDSEILEAQLISALKAQKAQLTSWELSGSDLVVYFTATVVGQKLGYDGLNADSVEGFLAAETTAIDTVTSGGYFLSALMSSLNGMPDTQADTLRHVTGITLVSMEVTKVELVASTPAQNSGSAAAPVTTTHSVSGSSSFTVSSGVVAVCAVAFGGVVALLVAVRVFKKSPSVEHDPLPTASVHEMDMSNSSAQSDEEVVASRPLFQFNRRFYTPESN